MVSGWQMNRVSGRICHASTVGEDAGPVEAFPRWSRGMQDQRAKQSTEQRSFWAVDTKCEPEPAGGRLDLHCDLFSSLSRTVVKTALAKILRLRDDVSCRQHQPVGRRAENKTHLIDQRRAACRC
jgi:hypothetical protein